MGLGGNNQSCALIFEPSESGSCRMTSLGALEAKERTSTRVEPGPPGPLLPALPPLPHPNVNFLNLFYWSAVDLRCCASFECTAKHILFMLFPHLGAHRMLSRVPCAVQQVLVSYLFREQ